MFSYASDSKCIFAFATLMAITNGLIFPSFSIIFAKTLTVFLTFDSDPVQSRKESDLYGLIFLLIAIVTFFANFFQTFLFSYLGEKITEKIRIETYRKMLKMPITWFDVPKNSSGGLTSRLASDCKKVNGLTTTFISIIIQNISTLLSAIIIAFIFEWRTTLVTLALIPFMVLAGAAQMSLQTGFSGKSDAAYK